MRYRAILRRTPPIPDRPRLVARRYRLVVVLLLVVVSVIHVCLAVRRSSSLLEHDEAISLLVAAGKSDRIQDLYANLDRLTYRPASELHHLLRPDHDTSAGDVVRSLSHNDIHPPLYFLILHGLATLAPDKILAFRLIGTLFFLVTGWLAMRWGWPRATPTARLLGLAWLFTTPVLMDVATELRQYSLVYLGVAISLAALIALWEEKQPVRHTVMFLALAPVVLLWTQYGTLVWIAVAFLAALTHLLLGKWRRWPILAIAASVSMVLVAPVLLWGKAVLSTHTATASDETGMAIGSAASTLARSLAEAWCSLPWALKNSPAPLIIAAFMFVMTAVFVWRHGRSVDRVLWCAAVGWCGVWMFLLAGGKIPPHAGEAKYLAPLVLVSACLVVRAGSEARPLWMRRTAIAVLAVSLTSHVLGIWQLFAQPVDTRLVTALRSADCLVIDTPKRGYVLPLIAKMKPDALVAIGGARVTLEWWEALESRLPKGGLVLAEIDSCRDGKRNPLSREVFDRFSARYLEVVSLREGPRRTITCFRHRRTDNTERQQSE